MEHSTPADSLASLAAGLAATARPLAEARTLPRRVYVSPAILGLEQRAIFGRMWLCIGREEDLDAPGSFLTQKIGSVEQVRREVRDGFVFVNLDQDAQCLADALSDLPDLARYRLGELRRAHRVEYTVEANWKVIAENYSECYHCPMVHPQLDRLSDLSRGGFQTGSSFSGGPMLLRDGAETMSTSGTSALAPISGLSGEDLRQINYYLVYPNLMLGLHPQYVLVHQAWPLAPDRTRVTCEWFFPPATLAAAGFDPSPMIDFWDLTNRQDWALCERVQRGAASMGCLPGPYHPSERCVHAFDKWYAEAIGPYLPAA